jgi:hypothetical protein
VFGKKKRQEIEARRTQISEHVEQGDALDFFLFELDVTPPAYTYPNGFLAAAPEIWAREVTTVWNQVSGDAWKNGDWTFGTVHGLRNRERRMTGREVMYSRGAVTATLALFTLSQARGIVDKAPDQVVSWLSDLGVDSSEVSIPRFSGHLR